MLKLVSIIFFGILIFTIKTKAQTGEADSVAASEEEAVFEEEEEFNLITDTPLTIDLKAEEEEEEEEEDEKKRKKNVYYGLKTKKGYTKAGFGNRITLEIFHYLKDYVEPDPYVRDIYWYDFKSRRVRISGKIDKEYAGILHGPYKKMVNEEVVEEGIFFKGTKHGRWMSYGKMYDYYIVTDKEKYYKGWPKESKVTYYDDNGEKLKEVIPVEYGIKNGNYFYFHENGLVGVQGEFRNDVKVGKWVEYYEFRRRRKREIQYRMDPYNEDFVPFIIREWDQSGEVIYDKEARERRLSSNY